MNYELTVLDGAHEDLVSAAIWYERNVATSGTRFLHDFDFEKLMEEIRQRPLTWPVVVSRPHLRFRVVRKGQYKIIYEIVDAMILVHAIAHASRGDYWVDRV